MYVLHGIDRKQEKQNDDLSINGKVIRKPGQLLRLSWANAGFGREIQNLYIKFRDWKVEKCVSVISLLQSQNHSMQLPVVCLNSWSYQTGLIILDKCPREIIFVWFFDREHCISSWSEKHVVVFCSHINHSQLSFFLWNFHSSSQAFWGVAPINLKNFSGATPKSVSKSHVKQ